MCSGAGGAAGAAAGGERGGRGLVADALFQSVEGQPEDLVHALDRVDGELGA